jgi:uncharacterized protein YcgL (UPF0745 family)
MTLNHQKTDVAASLVNGFGNRQFVCCTALFEWRNINDGDIKNVSSVITKNKRSNQRVTTIDQHG